MTDAPKTIAEMREAAIAAIWRVEVRADHVGGRLSYRLGATGYSNPLDAAEEAIRAIPLPADNAPTEAKHGERIDYTAAQLQAMGEAYAAAYADAMAERAVSDDDLVEKGARALAKLYGLEDFAPFYEDARVALSAMRGEPTQPNAKMEE